MKNVRVAVFFLIMTVFAVPAVFATPPSDLTLAYNTGTRSLEVTMRHVTIEVREHYIRTIRVTVNDGEPAIFRYPFQKNPRQVDAIIPLDLKPGDRVLVRAECKLGGNAEAELVIPAAAPSEVEEVSGEPVSDEYSEIPYGEDGK